MATKVPRRSSQAIAFGTGAAPAPPQVIQVYATEKTGFALSAFGPKEGSGEE